MKVYQIFIAVLILSSLKPATFSTSECRIKVSGTVTETRKYCGGARPTAEILAQLNTPKPSPNKKIYIKKGKINTLDNKVILALSTDAKGNFNAKLKPGTYLIVDSTKKDLNYYNQLLLAYKEKTESYKAIDSLCLKEWYEKADYVFEVTKSGENKISLNYLINCEEYVPCTTFLGPFRQ